MQPKPFVEYTPDSQLKSPGNLIRAMIADLLASRELAWRLMVRDISTRYRRSALGIAWAFLPPLATALVFIVLNQQDVLNVGAVDIPYPAYVMIGTILWQLFTDSLNSPLRIVLGSRSMLAKINFPREALILAGIGQVLFDFGIKLVIVAIVFVAYRLQLTWGILLAPVAIIMLMLLGIMIGVLLTPLGVLYSDIGSGLTILTSLWFFITPVVYSPPERWPFSLMAVLNPVSPLIIAARDLITKGVMTNIIPFAVVSGLTVLGLFLMWVVFRVSLPILIERMSA